MIRSETIRHNRTNPIPTKPETTIPDRLPAAGLNPPKSVTLAVTNQCNLSCRHCWPDSGPKGNAPVAPTETILRLISEFAGIGTERFIITGGEPLTHPGWREILSAACTLPGVREVRLQTNAILLTPDHVTFFSELKGAAFIIQTSLEGAQAAAHDQIRGNGSFDQTWRGLNRLIDAGMAHQICIAFTEMRHNFEQIPDVLEMLDVAGISRCVTGTLVATGRAAQANGPTPPTPAQYSALLARYEKDAAFRERYHRIGNIAAIEWLLERCDAAATCCALIETPYLSATGELYPCVLLPAVDYAATGLHHRPLDAALSEMIDSWARLQKISRSRLTELSGCSDCPHYGRCGAGCMGRAFAAGGSLNLPEDRCALRKAVYRHNSTPLPTINGLPSTG